MLLYLGLNSDHQIVLIILHIYFTSAGRILSDVAEGLILSSDNPFNFHASFNMLTITSLFKISIDRLKH